MEVPNHVKPQDRKVYKLKQRIRNLEARVQSLQEKIGSLERLRTEQAQLAVKLHRRIQGLEDQAAGTPPPEGAQGEHGLPATVGVESRLNCSQASRPRSRLGWEETAMLEDVPTASTQYGDYKGTAAFEESTGGVLEFLESKFGLEAGRYVIIGLNLDKDEHCQEGDEFLVIAYAVERQRDGSAIDEINRGLAGGATKVPGVVKLCFGMKAEDILRCLHRLNIVCFSSGLNLGDSVQFDVVEEKEMEREEPESPDGEK